MAKEKKQQEFELPENLQELLVNIRDKFIKSNEELKEAYTKQADKLMTEYSSSMNLIIRGFISDKDIGPDDNVKLSDDLKTLIVVE